MGAPVEEFSPTDAAALGSRVAANIAAAIKAPDGVLRELLVALLAEGHVLIEDRPGVGKTALARALARSIDAEYSRIQCTSDLLPGRSRRNKCLQPSRQADFEFRAGPVFAHLVLVDEINRASPRTQSGLLECDARRHRSPSMARAIPWPVPSWSWSHPEPDRIRGHLSPPRGSARPLHGSGLTRLPITPAGGRDALRPRRQRPRGRARGGRHGAPDPVAAQQAASAVHASDALRDYVVGLVGHTREDPRVALGASPRAG